MRNIPAALAALAVGLSLSQAVQAQPMAAGTLFDRFVGGDGRVAREELVTARARLFDRLDRNGDRTLDVHELAELEDAVMERATSINALLSRHWRRVDADGDGVVTADEFGTRAVVFDLADRDGDGTLTAGELIAFRRLVGREDR